MDVCAYAIMSNHYYKQDIQKLDNAQPLSYHRPVTHLPKAGSTP
jgi:hypothetical protein